MQPATAANGWVNTLESDHPDVLAKARYIMATIHYCTLSTCSADGLPWVSPVFFAYDANWHIYCPPSLPSTLKIFTTIRGELRSLFMTPV